MDSERATPTISAESLATKFEFPRPNPFELHRPRLIGLLPVDPPPLTAFVAPGGFGKSSVVAAWTHSLDVQSVLLRLDSDDSEPQRFGRYLAEAINRIGGFELSRKASAALAAEAAFPASNRLTPMLNEVGAASDRMHVVLDDYHAASSDGVDEILAFLLNNAPDTLRFSITSRTKPGLPLARLRGAGRLTEITMAQLALDVAEVQALVELIAGTEVTNLQAVELHRATEGWPVMVALAARSLSMSEPREQVIDGALGRVGRSLDEYVLEQVLSSLDGDDAEFVRTASVLDEFSGALADSVCNVSGSGARIERLLDTGFPVQRLNGRRPWYRFHQLVVETLREELLAHTDSDVIRNYHRRAAEWLESEGLVERSLDHALAGGDDERAVRLFETNWLDFANRGDVSLARKWLAQFPDDLVKSRPALALATAWTNLMVGHIDLVRPFLDAATASGDESARLPGASSVASGVALVETLHLRVAGRLSDACRSAELALDLEPDPDSKGRPRALAYSGICSFWRGQFDNAARLLNLSIGASERRPVHMARLLAHGYLGLVHAEQKDIARLQGSVAEAQELIDLRGLHVHPAAAPAYGAAGLLAVANGQFDLATETFEHAIVVASIQGDPGLLAYLHLSSAQVHDHTGEADKAASHRATASRLCARAEEVGFVAARCGVSRFGEVIPDVGLTAREAEVLRLMSSSLSLPEIANELFVSRNTVKTHAKSIYRKLGVTRRDDAVRVAGASQL